MLEFKWESFSQRIHYLTASIHVVYVASLITYVWKTFLIRQAYDPYNPEWADLPSEIRCGLTEDELSDKFADNMFRPPQDLRIYPPTSYLHLFMFGICLIIPLFYDSYQALTAGAHEYLSQGWNWIDMTHIILGYVNIPMQMTAGTWNIYSKCVLILLICVAMAKTFYFMRVLESFSPIVMRLLNVISGLRDFLLFYLILIGLFSMAFNIFGRNESPEYEYIGYFAGGIFYSLRFSVADFDFSPALSDSPLSNACFWIVWLLLTILSFFIVLNVIIAKVTEVY